MAPVDPEERVWGMGKSVWTAQDVWKLNAELLHINWSQSAFIISLDLFVFIYKSLLIHVLLDKNHTAIPFYSDFFIYIIFKIPILLVLME